MPLSSFALAGRYPCRASCLEQAAPVQAPGKIHARFFFLKPCCKLVVHEAQKWWLWLHKLSMEAPDDLAKLCRVSTGV